MMVMRLILDRIPCAAAPSGKLKSCGTRANG
jgi:hypothetical protein